MSLWRGGTVSRSIDLDWAHDTVASHYSLVLDFVVSRAWTGPIDNVTQSLESCAGVEDKISESASQDVQQILHRKSLMWTAVTRPTSAETPSHIFGADLHDMGKTNLPP